MLFRAGGPFSAAARFCSVLVGSGACRKANPPFVLALSRTFTTPIRRSGDALYRESLTKLREGIARFREADAAFMIQLGDLVDAAKDLETERQWLREAVKALREGGVELCSCLAITASRRLQRRSSCMRSGGIAGHYSSTVAGSGLLFWMRAIGKTVCRTMQVTSTGRTRRCHRHSAPG